MSEIKERIGRLREAMEREGVYAYYIPTSDFHNSEYVGDYFKVREFFSGFTGSAGDLLVTLNRAFLWTDGRYFLQAEGELTGSGIELMKMGEEGVPDIYEFLKKNMPEGAVLGFDGRTVSAATGKRLKKNVSRVVYKKDLSEGIFIRPEFPSGAVENLPDEITGMSVMDKLGKLREEMKKKDANGLFISKLDDIAYILNIRGRDVKYNPVVMSFLYITDEKTYLFTGTQTEKPDVAYHGIIIKPYDEVSDFLKSKKVYGRVMVDAESLGYLYFRLIKKRAEVIEAPLPSEKMKAVKNETEIRHLKEIYLKDSVALTRFIKYLTQTDEELTEISASDRLLSFRKSIPEFKDLSFETISAYGKNAAIIHYEPSEDNVTRLERKGMYMVDSGGQYTGGTTDVTRTVVMGELSEEEKKAFTLTAAGMLNILDSFFLKGTTGHQLDVLARLKMWKNGMNYRHGTGHGVGYMLNVHEGPHSIRNKATGKDCPLEPGMLVSDEPGVYIEGKFGVRTENILIVENAFKTGDGEFYRFENLTVVPIDHRGMDYRFLNDDEIRSYESYQKKVCEILKDELNEEEREWLYDYSGVSGFSQ